MGAAIVELIVAKRPVRGAALLAPVPPAGLLPIASRLAARTPNYLMQMGAVDPSAAVRRRAAGLRPFYFSDKVSRKDPRRGGASPEPGIAAGAVRSFAAAALGAAADRPPAAIRAGRRGRRICTPDDVRATAAHHNVEATILPGLAHMLMLEPELAERRKGARRLARDARLIQADRQVPAWPRSAATRRRIGYFGRLPTNSMNSCAGSGLLTQ